MFLSAFQNFPKILISVNSLSSPQKRASPFVAAPQRRRRLATFPLMAHSHRVANKGGHLLANAHFPCLQGLKLGGLVLLDLPSAIEKGWVWVGSSSNVAVSYVVVWSWHIEDTMQASIAWSW